MNVKNKHMKDKNDGFTLIELMITLAVAAIVLTVGLPSFSDFSMSNRMTSQTNDLITSISMARSEAITRSETISICASSNQASCNSSDWADGWIITASDGTVIRVFDGLADNYTLTNSDGLATLQYASTGYITTGTTSFSFCHSTKTGEKGRDVNISASGRPNNVSPYPICA